MFGPKKPKPQSEATTRAMQEYNQLKNERGDLKLKRDMAERSRRFEKDAKKAAALEKEVKSYDKKMEKLTKQIEATAAYRSIKSGRSVDQILAEDANRRSAGKGRSVSSSSE